MWYKDFVTDDEIVELYGDYKKRKPQKAKIKEMLMPTAWHPSRWWDWCVPENEKKYPEKTWKGE